MNRFRLPLLIAIAAALWRGEPATNLFAANAQENEAENASASSSHPNASPAPLISETPSPTNPLPPFTSPVEDIFEKKYWYLVLQDTGQVFTAPGRWDTRSWLMFGGIAAGIGTVMVFDEDLKRFIRHNQTHAVTEIFDAVQPFGNEYAFGVIGAFYLTGEVFKEPRAKATALDCISATAIGSGIVATSLKYTVGRARPTNKVGAYDFEPFSGKDSFCSGHTTEAFVLASVISDHYPSTWVAITSYTLASMVGYARLNNNRHWSSDVLAGAAVGTFVGKTVVHFNQKHRQASLQPIIERDMRGAQVSIAW